MAGKRPVFTEHFSANITVIEVFLGPSGRRRFARLLDHLFDDVIPTLCRFPRSGRSFLVLRPRSSFVVSLSNHERNSLKVGALRHAQCERIITGTYGTQH
ncbi:MAG: hypothetical protein AB7G48_05930 [Nitrospiraceae bacterium]